MPAGHWKVLAGSWILLSGALLGAGVLLALIGSTVLPQAGLFVYASAGLLLFVGVQLVMFRLFGLRSHADEASSEATARHPADSSETPHAAGGPVAAADERAAPRDWRAWRG